MSRRAAQAEPPVIEQDNATGIVSYWQKTTQQSAADRVGVSTGYYIHAMFGLLRQARSQRVLMLGGGGGTLGTMLHRAGVRVAIVDISAASFDIARRYFHLPDDVECHVAEGRNFLRRHEARYDAIVLDAYSDRKIPRQFLSPAFFDLAKLRMAARDAIFLMNLIVDDDGDPLPARVARLMRETWRHVRVLDTVGWPDRNAIAMAGAVSKLKRPTLLMPPRGDTREVRAALKELDFRPLNR